MKFGKYLATRSLSCRSTQGILSTTKPWRSSSTNLRYRMILCPCRTKRVHFFQSRKGVGESQWVLPGKAEWIAHKAGYFDDEKNKLFSQSSVEKSSIDFISLYESLKKFSSDLDRLQQFVELNEAGFTKVLKNGTRDRNLPRRNCTSLSLSMSSLSFTEMRSSS